MALIKLGENTVLPFRGDHAPIRIYHGENKIAGWEESTATGQSITAENTYNDAAHVEILGNAELQSDYVECWGGSSQDGTPSIDSPIEVTPLVPAGTYKITTDHGIYEATIPDLHGIEDSIDKVVFDRISGKGYHLQKCGNADLTGDESFSLQNPGVNDYGIISYYAKISSDKAEKTTTKSALSSILPFRLNGLSTAQQAGFMVQSNPGGSTIYLRVLAVDYPDAQSIKNKFAELASAGTPAKIVWQLINPVSTSITFTKVDASDAPELPRHVFEDGIMPSHDNPVDIVPASGALTTSCGDKQSTQTIPPLYGIKNADGIWAARDKLVIDDSTKTAWVERNTSIIVLDGTETARLYTYLDSRGIILPHLLNENYDRPVGLCTHEAKVGLYTTKNDHFIWIGVNNDNIYWVGILDVLGISTVDEFKTWISAQYAAGTPVTIVYALAAPTIEPIDYTTAKTYYPQTMIELTSNLPMDMSVTYKYFNAQYETITDSEEAYSKIVPAGGKYASIKAIGGKSVVWNQLYKGKGGEPSAPAIKLGISSICSGYEVYLSGVMAKEENSDVNIYFSQGFFAEAVANHKYLYRAIGGIHYGIFPFGNVLNKPAAHGHSYTIVTAADNGYIMHSIAPFEGKNIKNGTVVDEHIHISIFDLTKMFGAGNEPTSTDDPSIAWIKQYAEAHPEYNAGELVSAEVERVKYNEAVISDIPAAIRSLPGYGWSAGEVCNAIERTDDGLQYVQRVKKYTFTGNESWNRYGTTSAWISYDLSDAAYASGSTIMSVDFNGRVSGSETSYSNDGDCWLQSTSAYKRLYVCNSAATTEQDMKQFTIGKTIYYPLATPITTDITSIMGDFKNRFAVGAGGRITFENAVKLSVPNTVEYTVQK